jgi:hypothetical protein
VRGKGLRLTKVIFQGKFKTKIELYLHCSKVAMDLRVCK